MLAEEPKMGFEAPEGPFGRTVEPLQKPSREKLDFKRYSFIRGDQFQQQ
jgi:hypothetical protein